jgi:hypothetical protein
VSTLVSLQFFNREGDAGAADEPRRPVATLHSSARYQFASALEDLALRIARRHPDVPAGTYPAEATWNERSQPVLTVKLPNGRSVHHTYPPSVLQGSETLAKQRPDLAQDAGKLFYVAGPSDQVPPAPRAAVARWQLIPEGGTAELDAELPVLVEEYPVAEHGVQFANLLCLGAHHALPGDVRVVCDPQVLRALARNEAEHPEADFKERGWYLIGRIVRAGAYAGLYRGDLLVLVDEAVPAAHTVAGPGYLVWTEATKSALSDELARREEEGRPRRAVGWVHTHHCGALALASEQSSAGPVEQPAEVERSTATPPADGRFFSSLDQRLHRKDFPPAAVAFVLDSEAAHHDAADLARAFCAFGILDGLVAHRAVFLGDTSRFR